MNGWLIPELERILSRAHAEQRQARTADRYRETQRRVEEFLVAHPEATANAVWREIRGRRRDVLQAVRELRARYPLSRNQPDEETG